MMDEPPPPADARLPYGPDPNQFVDFRRSTVAGTRPLAIMTHGGFWRARVDLTYAGHLCIALGHAGYATANLEYRRVGHEGGGWPGTLEDVRRAVEFARERAPEFDGDPARAIVLGHSAGGHLALWLSAEIGDLRGVISLGGVASLRHAWELRLSNDAVGELMGGPPDRFPDRYAHADPEQRPTAVPRVLIHGTADDIVPVEIVRKFGRNVRLVEIPDGDHFGLINPASADWPTVLREVTALT
jgi:acetyl esterase/lipase